MMGCCRAGQKKEGALDLRELSIDPFAVSNELIRAGKGEREKHKWERKRYIRH